MFYILFLIILISEIFTLLSLFQLTFPHGTLVPYVLQVFFFFFNNVSCSFFLSSYLWKVFDTWDTDVAKLCFALVRDLKALMKIDLFKLKSYLEPFFFKFFPGTQRMKNQLLYTTMSSGKWVWISRKDFSFSALNQF